MDAKTGIQLLIELGYEGPFATECSRAIDRELKKTQMADPKKLIGYVCGLVDKIFVFKVEEVLAGSAECFCAVRIILKHGELLMSVPWVRQYEQGACVCLFRMGDVGELEIDLVLANLIEIMQFGEHGNDQRYLM